MAFSLDSGVLRPGATRLEWWRSQAGGRLLVTALVAGCSGPVIQLEGTTEPHRTVLPDPTLCGNGVVDEGELCDNNLEHGGDCPEPWGMCWRCSESCQSRTVFVQLGVPTPYCSFIAGAVTTERRYDPHGNVLAEWTTNNESLLGRSQWLYDHRGRLLLTWKDGDNDGWPDLEIRNTHGPNGDIETVKLVGERSWHPKAPIRSSPLSPDDAVNPYNPYPNSERSDWSRRTHDAYGRIVAFEWQPRPGADHHDTYEYDSCCSQHTRLFTPDRDGNGQPDYSIRYTLDSECRPLTATEKSEQQPNNDRVYHYDYDKHDRLTHYRATSGTDTKIVWKERYSYDDSGRKIQRWTDQDGDGHADSEERLAYDELGNKTMWWVDSNGDGVPESHHLARYDAAGHLVWRSVDANIEGRMGFEVQHTWDADGIDETLLWSNGLLCHARLDLDEKMLAQVCQWGEQGPLIDETTWAYDPFHGLPLEERRIVESGEDAVMTRAYEYACLSDVFETMPWIKPRPAPSRFTDSCVSD